ncbi:hypothetical protein [Prosthecobacter sp.]|uniref:hypothetical protein n=1 Tax=Prosthecobacter sp. TaxID=1965333 RepID=UPI0037851C40
MSDTTYTLEWRGTKKSGFTYSAIEAGLSAGDIHSLYKIQVDGRWIVLRDFLEQHRAAAEAEKRSASAAAAAAEAQQRQQAAYAPQAHYPPQTAPYQPQYQQHYPHPGAPTHYPPQQAYAAAPPPPLVKGKQAVPMPHSPHAAKPAAHKPAWLWPLIIGSATLFILLGIVAVYFFATHKFGSSGSGTASASTSGTPKEKPDSTPAQVKFQPYSLTGKEFYPSALVSTAKVDWNGDAQAAEDKKTEDDPLLRKNERPLYGDENSWLGMDFSGLKKGDKVSIQISAEGFMQPSKEEVVVNNLGGDGTAMIMPKIVWNFESLTRVRQQRPINVIFSASVNGKELRQVTETYTMRSINDCPLLLLNKEGDGGTNLSFLFAAYVNEDHPQVQQILKEALESGLVKKFNGYQGDDPAKIAKQVRLQVFSIWNALQRRGIKYSNVVTTRPGDRVVSQSVRFLQESIDNHQANCVDGTVLMASVLHKIGIQSYLVLVPNHCFLAFDEIPDSAALPTGLETTMLGHDDITDVKKMEFLSSEQQSKENMASAKTFVTAMEIGSSRIQACARNLEGQGTPKYRLISIEDERQNGIDPIPYTGDK